MQTFLLLGGNLGDRLLNLKLATEAISTTCGEIIKSSSIYETLAWGVTEQPNFLNQVIEINSKLEAYQLLTQINKIEKNLGRERHQRWHERTIDIDILYYGNECFNSETLIIPHKELHNRKFTLVPLAEIAPNFMHPILKSSNLQLLNSCTDELDVWKYLILNPNKNRF
ncbi:MAG: 2-amino-4-hydroxy-6-hydroxymethyldihydropteridine diphosphokinase [Flammeovirgaceae bacterium]|jgi:2-amino-4-hydroxy-6-hydroxymethyldihydropteridine diphosphokinase